LVLDPPGGTCWPASVEDESARDALAVVENHFLRADSHRPPSQQQPRAFTRKNRPHGSIERGRRRDRISRRQAALVIGKGDGDGFESLHDQRSQQRCPRFIDVAVVK
jgi:hypothetical protein